ncbi:hypothetical protein [Stieleria varia]|uniref:Uncharacterized protein n=1 Tax=Stieleria varia TaxID=2528005 RepID=A0A5C6A0F0_9BACT|nr:hypothetical protein [Stieleria varia]TWT92668.1 hypothetical protein Pla52n_60330 [Stieleria varia]
MPPSDPFETNPYAPSAELGTPSRAIKVDGVTGPQIVGRIMLAVTLAGGVFGLGSAATVALVALSEGGIGTDVLGVFLMMSFWSFIAGMILAGIPTVLITPLSYGIFASKRSPLHPISGREVLLLASFCGFVTGCLPTTLISGFQFYAIAWSLIPGVVGALLTPFCLIGFARRVDRMQKQREQHLELEAGLAPSPFAIADADGGR